MCSSQSGMLSIAPGRTGFFWPGHRKVVVSNRWFDDPQGRRFTHGVVPPQSFMFPCRYQQSQAKSATTRWPAPRPDRQVPGCVQSRRPTLRPSGRPETERSSPASLDRWPPTLQRPALGHQRFRRRRLGSDPAETRRQHLRSLIAAEPDPDAATATLRTVPPIQISPRASGQGLRTTTPRPRRRAPRREDHPRLVSVRRTQAAKTRLTLGITAPQRNSWQTRFLRRCPAQGGGGIWDRAPVVIFSHCAEGE
ncbi:hypothetical protein EV192_1011375 [Actinocrispum wychmicini]|uniref:Uncharacterized protein n=1 Tax=Actinocrispum wychmicini TaxID=1213861 RepID=A0A4R2JYA4_9PSEU|nr:hypothetical protein EV192_1011375 [Actinocrispum wychmicini]